MAKNTDPIEKFFLPQCSRCAERARTLRFEAYKKWWKKNNPNKPRYDVYETKEYKAYREIFGGVKYFPWGAPMYPRCKAFYYPWVTNEGRFTLANCLHKRHGKYNFTT